MRIRTWLAVMIAVITLGVLAFAQAPAARAEHDLYYAVNQARRSQGLAPLRWDESLAAAAHHHAEVMAEHGSAQHVFDGEPNLAARVKQVGVHFSWLSENVMLGSSSDVIHSQFMKSPNHRANILDSDMNSVGIGVVEQNGQLFAVENFAQIH